MRLTIACILSLIFPASLSAALPEESQVEPLVRPYLDAGRIHALVIGVLDERGQRIYCFGRLGDRPGSPAPTADTLFEIGSISKVFTGLLLADMTVRGQVSLDDPVQKHLPDSVRLLRAGGSERDVTLLDLATHFSGYPRMPANFLPKDWLNPYEDYDEARLYAFLRAHRPRYKPGEHHEYSNLAVGLLGHVLARRAGLTYDRLLEERVCRPMGLTSTRVNLDQALRGRLAPGHDPDGWATPNWDLNTMTGAGGVHSSMNDLLLFGRAQLSLADLSRHPDLFKAIALSQVPHARIENHLHMGLGWFMGLRTDPERKALQHSGMTGGYACQIHVNLAQRSAYVVLANDASPHIDTIASTVRSLQNGEPVTPPRVPARTFLHDLSAMSRRTNAALRSAANRREAPVESHAPKP